jgi:hypothetical protein
MARRHQVNVRRLVAGEREMTPTPRQQSSNSLDFSDSLNSFFPPIHEQFDPQTRQIKYEEDVCDASNCAAVALRGFSGKRRANF